MVIAKPKAKPTRKYYYMACVDTFTGDVPSEMAAPIVIAIPAQNTDESFKKLCALFGSRACASQFSLYKIEKIRPDDFVNPSELNKKGVKNNGTDV